MKKFISLILAALILTMPSVLTGCQDNAGTADSQTAGDSQTDAQTMEDAAALMSDNFRIDQSMLSYYVYSYYYDYYSKYASYLGISPYTALDEQYIESGSDETWFDYFADALAPQLKQILALCEGAKKSGVELDSSEKAGIDSNISAIEAAASSYGYSLNSYISMMYGSGVTESDVRTAMEYSYLSSKYYAILQDEKEASVTDDELNDYFNNNPDEFPTKDTTLTKNAAHILIQANGVDIAYDDDSTDYTSAAAKTKAEEVLAEYKSSAAQDLATFRTIGEKYTADSGFEYDNICKGDMVDEFNDWIYDESRKAGDTGIIKTDYGYHIMYFIGDGIETWKAEAREGVIDQKINDWLNEAYETFGVTLNGNLISEY